MNFKTPKLRSIVALNAAVAAAFVMIAPQPASAGLLEAARDAKPAFNVRYRMETVEQAGIDNTAAASTARARLSWIVPSTEGFSVGLEGDYVFLVGEERYNSTNNGRTEFPVVADPTGFDLNRAFVQYRNEGWTVTAGRQGITHAEQRFVGAGAWRQNEQTYDALRVQSSHGKASIDYSYVVNVNRVFGPRDGAQPGDWSGNSHLLRGEFRPAEGHGFGTFVYLLDFENDNGPANANRTYGVDYTASFGGGFSLLASIARQADWADNPQSYDATYYSLEGKLKRGPITFTAGYEVLGSDDGMASFRTPIAALHKFQGWSDKLVATPRTGLRDLYFKTAAKVGPAVFVAALHDFKADDGGADHGREVDIAITCPLGERFGLQFKLAHYIADQHASDTTKGWVVVTYRL